MVPGLRVPPLGEAGWLGSGQGGCGLLPGNRGMYDRLVSGLRVPTSGEMGLGKVQISPSGVSKGRRGGQPGRWCCNG